MNMFIHFSFNSHLRNLNDIPISNNKGSNPASESPYNIRQKNTLLGRNDRNRAGISKEETKASSKDSATEKKVSEEETCREILIDETA